MIPAEIALLSDEELLELRGELNRFVHQPVPAGFRGWTDWQEKMTDEVRTDHNQNFEKLCYVNTELDRRIKAA